MPRGQKVLVLSVSRKEKDWSIMGLLPPPKKVYSDVTPFLFFTAKIHYLTMTDARKVWMPDTFFRNEKEGRFHNILVPNVYIRIFPNGDVLYSIR